jgi:DNA-binding protein HU-beta
MNKVELTQAVAEKLQVSKAESGRIIEDVIGTMIDGAKNSGECVLPGLGKIVVVDTAAREGVTNGKAWSKPAGKTIKLRLSKAGKEILD